MNPEEWGNTVWWELHWLANKVDTVIVSMRAHTPLDKSAAKIQTDLLKMFVLYVKNLGEKLLPCKTCQKSTTKFLNETFLHPSNVLKDFQKTGVPKASAWMYQLHNLVNLKLNKPQLSVADFAKHQRLPAFQDIPLQSVLAYVEAAIRHCMPKWPQRKRTFQETFTKYLSPLLLSLHTHAEFANINSAQVKDLSLFGNYYKTFLV